MTMNQTMTTIQPASNEAMRAAHARLVERMRETHAIMRDAGDKPEGIPPAILCYTTGAADAECVIADLSPIMSVIDKHPSGKGIIAGIISDLRPKFPMIVWVTEAWATAVTQEEAQRDPSLLDVPPSESARRFEVVMFCWYRPAMPPLMIMHRLDRAADNSLSIGEPVHELTEDASGNRVEGRMAIGAGERGRVQ